MVWSQEREAERPQLSVILPRLYLGAESDVTQERLSSLGISYVLSVSRCSPQPSFLPPSRFLRIPIDDSLWAELLPWIPQALNFIDAAMSSGASVLVHCAAGISRSPALAVAYIMYRLDLDLDQAYRFVKDRRPSISPNFNFLGQLQHFQATLSQKASRGGDFFTQGRDQAVRPPSDRTEPPETVSMEPPSSERADIPHEDSGIHRESAQQRLWPPDVNGNHQQDLGALQNLHVDQQSIRSAPSPPALGLSRLQPPSGSASLSEKRKSLTLSLSPVLVSPPPRLSREAPGGLKQPPRAKEAGLLSPFSLTLNKLMDWGERVLLGGVFLPPIRMGQPALPYRC